jgi:D-3-phosphoglycerate dehydrogenase
MKPGVRIVNCARGELVDEAALRAAVDSGKVAGAALDVFSAEPPPPGYLPFGNPNVLATPHIAGSTEEAQEIVGVRIAEQVVEYLKNGIAVNAVNMPALSPERFRALRPYAELAGKLGHFAAHIAIGNPRRMRLTYFGKIAEGNTSLLRSAGLAGALSRSSAAKTNMVNAMQIAEHRGWDVAEAHEKQSVNIDTIRVELETEGGTTTVEGSVFLDKPRLTRVNGIFCELALSGPLVFMINQDVPGVIGHVGTVLGRNAINIANFSLGRRDAPLAPGDPLEALALVATDELVSESVLEELRQNPAVKIARSVDFHQ